MAESGLRRPTRNRVNGLSRSVGSNPTLSAKFQGILTAIVENPLLIQGQILQKLFDFCKVYITKIAERM
jgi:hypothetical protein